METAEIETLLQNTAYGSFIGSVQRVELKNHTYSDLFKIGKKEAGYYAIKIRKNSEDHIIDSLDCIAKIIDPENVVHKNTDVFEKDGLIIQINKWIKGKQPIDTLREKIPEIFGKLAYINKKNIVNGPYTTMYAEGERFETIEKMINRHKDYLPAETDWAEIYETLKSLKKGIPCIITEDINTGNMFITDDGEYKIIDLDWLHGGLNLYQFDHFDYFNFHGNPWYVITGEEAKESYTAYFDELGINKEEANEQIRAVEVLSILRQNTHWKRNNRPNEEEIKRRMKIVLEKDRFI
jgi:thiamine kinase-like enzyme